MLNKIFKWITRVSDAVNLEIKILGITVGFILVLGAGVTLEMRNIVQNLMLEELDKQGVSISRDLSARSADLVLTNQVFILHQLLNDTRKNNRNVRYAFVINHDGDVIAHTFADGVPTNLIYINTFTSEDNPNRRLINTGEGKIHDFAMPILGGKVGVVRIGLDQSNVIFSVQKITTTILQTTLLMSIIGILAAYILANVLYQPILRLVEATHKFSAGDYTQRVEVSSNDEFGNLGQAFNKMGETLAHKEKENKQLLAEIEKKEQVRKSLLKKVITAQEMERKRVSRELHDETGQLLSALMVQLQCIKQVGKQENFDQNVDNMRKVISRTIGEVKRISRQLRPSVLDDMGLIPAIERLVQEYQEFNHTDIDFIVHGHTFEKRLLAELEITIYRILQEALTNIFKYSKAENVSIIMNFKQDALQIIIEDDGIGFDVNEHYSSDTHDTHLGLHGMRERAELINGNFEIESKVGIGTTIYVSIPLVFEDQEEILL
ncbi:hypothetical protein BHU72_10240 [Desulfuribacillus stibiiarsenatis]|uniref:histidine kinase n=1 Tax=Desulfuribacillus stibiiarsenatis TaxID=1390249 RepID=A0A1E5L925_9FIRM|nr:ATP-binding protein [Desulfuribacillus stibiiarsenatis]OEH86626.1 hypothetical protein BHU72_10240 [Desulfuribacillus stibiiarsenatis]